MSAKNQKVTIIQAVANNVSSKLNTRGSHLLSDAADKFATVSFENLTVEDQAQAQMQEKEILNTIAEAYAQEGAEDEFAQLTQAQKDAAVIATNALKDPAAYHDAATRGVQGADFGIDVSSNIDSRTAPAMEAFDNRNLSEYVHYSPIFNLEAARQDAFGEMFYKTITTTPDNAGMVVKIERTMVHNDYNHLGDGAPAPENFFSKSLIDAAIDHRVLLNDSTIIHPQWSASNEFFSKKVGPTEVQVGSARYKTAPLLVNRKLNLLSISQNPTLDPNGVNDVTDSLDNSLALRNLYLTIKDAEAHESVIKVPVWRLPLTEFQHAQEGFDRDMVLSYRTSDIPLTHLTKAVDGTEAEALAYLKDPTRQNWTIRLGLTVNGTANLEVGNIEVTATSARIDSIWEYVEATKRLEQVNDPEALKALQAAIPSITVDSYDVYSRRSNLNRRQRGLLVRIEVFRERYMIPLGSPVTALQPITETKTLTDIAGPIDAVRSQNSNNAVTKLFEYCKTLEEYKVSLDRRTQIPRIEGIGRLYVRPYVDHIEFDLTKVVNSVQSHERAEDIRAALTELLRDRMAKAANQSGYLAALKAAGGKKATVAIGTEPRIQRYLVVNGDTRLLGDMFEYKIEHSTDQRMYGTIFATFIRPDVNEPDGLNFGNMIWIPELITDVPNTRGGAQAREFMVQPRVRHLNMLPLLVRIDVKGLDEVTAQPMGITTINGVTNEGKPVTSTMAAEGSSSQVIDPLA